MTRDLTGEENLPVYTNNIPAPFKISFTQQNDWSTGELIAFYLGGVGAGLYIVSQFLHSAVGLVVGFILVAIGKNVAHIISSTQPKRSLRALLRPHTSWISRGAIFILLFIVFGFLEITHVLGWMQWSKFIAFIFSFITFVSALFIMIYLGFVLADARTIPLWNSPIMPAIFLIYSIAYGAGAAAIISPFMDSLQKFIVLTILFIAIILSLLLIIVQLIILKRSGLAAMVSYELLVKKNKNIFIGGVLSIGLFIPLCLAGISLYYSFTSNILLMIMGICVLVGGLFYQKSILEAATFAQLLD